MAKTTKRALASSLKKLLTQKTLDKITVVDIVEDYEVNRQTFYYHFQDIYDLIDWIFIIDSAKAIDGKNTYDTWQQGFLHVFEYVLENKSLIANVYDSISRDKMEKYLYDVTYDLLINVVDEKSINMHIRDEDKQFIANFYKFAFVGLMLEWIKSGMKEKPEKIIDKLSILIKDDITRALEKYQTHQYVYTDS